MNDPRDDLLLRKRQLNDYLRQFYDLERLLGQHFADLAYYATTYWQPLTLYRSVVHLNAEYLLIKYLLVALHYDCDQKDQTLMIISYVEYQIKVFISKLKNFERFKSALKIKNPTQGN